MQQERDLDFYVSTPDSYFNSRVFTYYIDKIIGCEDIKNSSLTVLIDAIYESYFYIMSNHELPFKCLEKVENVVKTKNFTDTELKNFSKLLSSILYRHDNAIKYAKNFILISLFKQKYNIDEDNEDEEEYIEFVPDPKFDFNLLKAEIDKSDMLLFKKIETIEQRLFDFLQWQQQYDSCTSWKLKDGESEFEITNQYYPKFEALCKLELDRLKALTDKKLTLDVEKSKLQTTTYRIASKRKTDVIKILSAMYDCRMFVDTQGKPITNKQELMEAFGEFFNDDFKSYSTLLSQAKDKEHSAFYRPFDQIRSSITAYYEGE